MRVLLHEDAISVRGTTQATFDYASALAARGHEVLMTYPESGRECDAEMLAMLRRSIDVTAYSSPRELEALGVERDAVYWMRNGVRGVLIPRVRNVVHVVFQVYEPHGEYYGYISPWLAERMRQRFRSPGGQLRGWGPRGLRARRAGCETAFEFPHVSYICETPAPQETLRSQYGIPDDAFLMCRYGGFDTFDIPWVQSAVESIVERDPDAYFLGVNTKPFTNHPRVIFAPPVVDRQAKANLLASADVFLHGRASGESFGLSIVEALQVGLPVLAWAGGWDRNHVALLGDSDMLYSSREDLLARVARFRAGEGVPDSMALQRLGNAFRAPAIVPHLERALTG